MKYKYYYKTPDDFSDIWMNSDGEFLTGLWFEGSRDAAKHCIDLSLIHIFLMNQIVAYYIFIVNIVFVLFLQFIFLNFTTFL